MIFNKKTNQQPNKKQKQILELIFNIGYGLIYDLSNPENETMTLTQYGEYLLKKYPLLTELKNTKKGGLS